MREVLDLLKEADAILRGKMNALYGQGLTSETSPTLRRMRDARRGIWQARRVLEEEEEEPCEKS